MTVAFLESVLIRGIEGFIADSYLRVIADGHLEPGTLAAYGESHNIAIQVYMQWKGWGMK